MTDTPDPLVERVARAIIKFTYEFDKRTYSQAEIDRAFEEDEKDALFGVAQAAIAAVYEWQGPMELDHFVSIRVLVKSPELFDADFNQESIAEGVLLPVHEGKRIATCAVWNEVHDCFYSTEVSNIEAVLPLPPAPEGTE